MTAGNRALFEVRQKITFDIFHDNAVKIDEEQEVARCKGIDLPNYDVVSVASGLPLMISQ